LLGKENDDEPSSCTLMSKSTLLITVAFIVSIGVSVFSVNTDTDYGALKKQLKVSHILHKPDKKLPDFALIDHNEQPYNNAHLKDQWTLLTFIYTHCPDVCPTVLMDMASIKMGLESAELKVIPELVAITFDPKRDTPKVLKTYVTHFDKDFIGISGDQAQIDQLIKPFGTYYERLIEVNGESIIIPNGTKLPEGVKNYSINHTAWMYLLSPDGQIFAGFPTPHKPNAIAKDIELIINNY
jgi:Uncharacterized protein SCO1/SenC/PrrC, involved in biogenesis of respiratory and photosynthetic systems